MSSPDPLKQAEQAALNKVNAEKATITAWARTHWHWLVALAIVFGFGLIVAKLV